MMIDVLTDKNQKIHFQNGRAAIHLSCDADIIKELITSGADPYLQDKVHLCR